MQMQGNISDLQIRFTAKQMATLDLLVKHMTSKEIFKVLGISPHTVDQRIETAKRKLGVSTRGELVQAYLTLKRTCHQLTYEETLIDTTELSFELADLAHFRIPGPQVDPQRNKPDSDKTAKRDYTVGPDFLDGRMGAFYRVIAVFGIAGIIMLVLMATAAFYIEMSEIVVG